MRESNGPIYVASAFKHVVLLSRPKQHLPERALELFRDVKRVKSRVTRAAFEFLYPVAGQK